MHTFIWISLSCKCLKVALAFFGRAQQQRQQAAAVPQLWEGCAENNRGLLSATQRAAPDFPSLWGLCQHSGWVLHAVEWCQHCMLVIKFDWFERHCRFAAGEGHGYRSPSNQLPPAATTQPKTPPASAATNGSGLPQSPPASTQRHHRYPHAGTHSDFSLHLSALMHQVWIITVWGAQYFHT